MTDSSFLSQGDACWCVAESKRVSFLQNADAYFEQVHEAMLHARRTIYVAGWDVASEVDLMRGRDVDHPTTLCGYLAWLTKRNPDLRVKVLNWDFSMIYAQEREILPIFSTWDRIENVELVMDNAHPLGGSHHQKFVVVDDALAFAGGIDITGDRWDTPEHKPDDPLRVNPKGDAFGPFHDLQMAMNGEAAARLGELFRIRWERATGRTLEPPKPREEPLWPEPLPTAAEDVRVCIARTEPAYDGRDEVREVERQVLGVIGAAERHLYIENQYFGSEKVRDALKESLRRENGPEIVMVLPENASSWLARKSLDRVRDAMLRELVEADEHGRLGLYYPAAPDGEAIYVHSKLLIADDELMVLGPANLVNRSFGLDSELNIGLDATDNPGLRRAIEQFRHALLSEFLGCNADEIASTLEGNESMRQLISDCSDRNPRLDMFDPMELEETPETPIVPKEFADPNEPMDIEAVMHSLFDARMVSGAASVSKGKLWRVIIAFVVLAALFAAWRFTPLSEWMTIERLTELGETVRGYEYAGLYVVGGFALGGAVMVPVTLMVVTVAVLFDPLTAFLYSLAGILISSSAVFLVGSALGRSTLREYGGKRINNLSRKLSDNGLWTVAVLRNLPVAPFTLINLLAGAMGVGFLTFLGGTALGMAPGLIIIDLMSETLVRAIVDGDGTMLLIGLGFAALFVALGWAARKLGRGRKPTADNA